eukprot:CAMPEP_0202832196 /NCGR_PEP_ID=MMETSP1389-20130828/17276_1 /ASSEMBLY_ACC=CAM_ASM_000865 /TAXON_ID=302021 /ORGANISM="Rhodomonas sp., Strain CCMP768" /LENGTH=47 /DNA_ID= /DNA_START= /DNA_END= /DNA_ORIENTATION=
MTRPDMCATRNTSLKGDTVYVSSSSTCPLNSLYRSAPVLATTTARES